MALTRPASGRGARCRRENWVSMFKRSSAEPTIPELLKALADPTRWNIVKQLAQQEEVACTTLEENLPISKSTISYHIKILYHAAVLEIRKEGRFYFYRLRRDVLDDAMREVIDDLGMTAKTGSGSVLSGAVAGVS
jgi:DNA-binding transcriptional ArsR family regulator